MRLLHHNTHLYLPHQLEALKKDLNRLYVVHSIRGFVFSLFGIFIPIYLLSIEFSLTFVLCFHIVRRFSLMFMSFISGSIGNRLGLKHTMLLSLPLALVYLVALSLLKFIPSLWLLFLLAMLGGIQASLYWIPLHSLFSRYTKTGHRSSAVSKLLSFQHMATMLAPLLGGIITVIWGFEALFVIAFSMLLLPIGLLFYSPEIKPHVNFKFRDGLHLFKKYKKYYFQVAIDFFGEGAESVLWPIFIFSILANSLAIGFVGTLVGFGTIIFTLIIGKKTNRKNRTKMIRVSALLLAFVWSMKFFASTPIIIYTLSVLAGFFAIMFSVPHMAETYALAKKDSNPDEFIIFREVAAVAGKIPLLLLAIFLHDKIEWSFIVAGLNYLILFFI
ncbi:MAG: MFS transporter [Patescibacteria group bacterium]|nr:MFS transporter [Patescibacteria group bacterium]